MGVVGSLAKSFCSYSLSFEILLFPLFVHSTILKDPFTLCKTNSAQVLKV